MKVPRGALLNTATVLLGSLLGLAVGSHLPPAMLDVCLIGIGLVTIGIGLKMMLAAENVLVIAVSVAVGGALGVAMGISGGLEIFAEWARLRVGGGGRFNEALISTSILFCVGPMTLLGCIQDALENRLELIALKSVMDGIAAIFFAATMGPGVVVTAAVVLVVQGSITLMARRLTWLQSQPELLREASGAGGVILLAIGLGLAQIKKLPSESMLPALVVAPLLTLAWRKWIPASAS